MNFASFIQSNARWLSAGVLITFVSSFGQTFFISIFAAEIMSDFNLTDGQWGRIYGLGTLASGLTMIWLGGFSDIMRVRSLSIFVHLGMVGFCLAMIFNTSVWLLPVIIFGLRITGQGMSTHIAMVAMARWFTAARGKAIAIAALGFSIGEAFLPKIFAELLPHYEWRVLWLIPVVVVLILIPTLRLMLVKERTPQSISENEQSAGIGKCHWTRAQAFRSWVFWGILPVFLLPHAFGTALFFQQVHLAEAKGWGHSAFVALFPLFTGVSVISALVFGVLIDRFGATRLIKFVLLPMAASFAVFSVAEGLPHAAFAFVCLGIMAGGTSTTSVAFWPEVFGTRHIGSIKAMVAANLVIASAVGPVVSGYFIDQGVPFHDQMIWIAGLTLIVASIAWITSRSIYPKISD